MTRDLAPATPEFVGLFHRRAGSASTPSWVQSLIDKERLAGAVTLTARHGKTVRVSAMGSKDVASGAAMTTDTIFRIFSMTKPVTGVAMAILYDEGLWRPEDPIEKHLPEFAGVKVFDGLDAEGQPKLLPADHPPTMGELMTHTAGLSYGFNPEDPLDKLYQGAKVWQSGGLAEFAGKVAGLPLAYQPGSKWLYSLSMDVQGAMIERLTGQSLPDFYRTRIFEPLDMVDTAFHIPPEKKPRLSSLYRWTKDKGLKATTNLVISRDHETRPRSPTAAAASCPPLATTPASPRCC